MPIGQTNYPSALDDATTLIEVRDQGQTTLTADINDTTLTLPVTNTSTLPPTGVVTIAGEHITYSSKTLTQINAVTRAAFTALGGQAAAPHTSGSAVEILDIAATHKVLLDAIVAVETLLGANGVNFQPRDTELTALAGLTSAADRLPYFDGAGTAALATFTAAGRAIIDDANAAAQRSTLGLGTVATLAPDGTHLVIAGSTLDVGTIPAASITGLDTAVGAIRVVVGSTGHSVASNSSTTTWVTHLSTTAVLPAGTWEIAVLGVADYWCITAAIDVESRIGAPVVGTLRRNQGATNDMFTIMPTALGTGIVSDGIAATTFMIEFRKNSGGTTVGANASGLLAICRRTA